MDGYGDQAGGPGGEVQERPLPARAGHDGEPVARPQAVGDQALGRGPHLGGEAGRVDVAPQPVGLLAGEDNPRGVGGGVGERQVAEGAVEEGRGERRDGCAARCGAER